MHPLIGHTGWRLARPVGIEAVRGGRSAETRRWVVSRLRRLRRQAGALSPADWALLRQAATVLLMAGLTLAVVLGIGRPPGGLQVAGPGRCYIAEDVGLKWHAVRQCPALAQALSVQETTIENAMAWGEGVRWQRPCGLCGAMLREHRSARAKQEEYERVLLDLAFHEGARTVAAPPGGR